MPTYYQIDMRNSSGKEPLYDITSVEIENLDPNEKRDYTLYSSFEDAKKAIAFRLSESLQRTQQKLAQIQHNLNQLETMYPAPILLNELLGGKLEELETGLKQLKEKKGTFKVGPLKVQNDYMDVPDLYVLTLPEYDTVNTTFDTKSMEMVMNTFKNLGMYIYSQWNGQSYYTWSIKAKEQDGLTM